MAGRSLVGMLVCTITFFGLAAGASAQTAAEQSYPRVALGANTGFATGSGTGAFVIGFDAPIEFNENFSLGPWMQIGMASGFTELLVSANARYVFTDLLSGKLENVRPFVQGGLGLGYFSVGGAGVTEMLINMGFGFEVPLNDNVYMGSDMMFNTFPTSGAGTAFQFSWQFVTLRYKF